jgi:transposase
MKRFVEGTDRGQITLFPAVLDDYVGEDNPVRAIDAFVDGLDLARLGFWGVVPLLATGRQAYHPAPLLKIYIYGYFNRVQSSRRLERECQRNVELVWLTGHLMPDFKTIADFRKDNGEAVRKVCRMFVLLNIFRKRANECRQLAARMRNPEHRKFAEDLVRAWIELAELEEREATSAVVFVSDPHSKSDPGPGDPIV